MSAGLRLTAGAGALALGLVFAGRAEAVVVSSNAGVALTATPYVVSLGGSAASYAFTAASTGNGSSASVLTSGTGKVASFFGSVTDFQAGATINQTRELYSFSAFPTASIIPNSAADDFIGLAFTLSNGVHYGYAEVAGAKLVSYGYDDQPGATIVTGAVAAVPEPASMAMLLVGGAGVWASRRRRQT